MVRGGAELCVVTRTCGCSDEREPQQRLARESKEKPGKHAKNSFVLARRAGGTRRGGRPVLHVCPLTPARECSGGPHFLVCCSLLTRSGRKKYGTFSL